MTVLVKGTKLGTSTDPEGNFKLSLPQQENTILIFSFIGMESQEVPVGDPKKPIKVILKETAENLKEVVVTGIFTRKKKALPVLLPLTPHPNSKRQVLKTFCKV